MNIDRLREMLEASNYLSIFSSVPNISALIVEHFKQKRVGIVSSTRQSATYICDKIPSERVLNLGNFEDAFRFLLEHSNYANKVNIHKDEDGIGVEGVDDDNMGVEDSKDTENMSTEKCDLIILNNCSYNPETNLHLSLFIKLYSILDQESRPKLIFIYRNLEEAPIEPSDIVFVEPIRNYMQFFNTEFNADEVIDTKMLVNKVHEMHSFYPDDEIILIVPTNEFGKEVYSTYSEVYGETPLMQCLTEDIALNTQFDNITENNIPNSTMRKKIFIDTCLRNLVYSSVGGGIRFIDSIVGSDYLTSINAIVRHTNGILYRLIDAETYNSLRVQVTPFVTMYQNLINHYNLPFKLATSHDILERKDIDFKPYLGNLGTQLLQSSTHMFQQNHESKKSSTQNSQNPAQNTIEYQIVSALIDTMDHGCVEYPVSTNENEKTRFFMEHFVKYVGKDSLEIFINLWNDSILYETPLDFIEENFINYTMYMEFYNVLLSLQRPLNNGSNKSSNTLTTKISPKTVSAIRDKLLSMLEDKKLTITDISQLYVYEATDASGEVFTVVKNLLFRDLKEGSTIYPISRNENIIKTFFC